MGDLIMGIGLIGLGVTGLISMPYLSRKLPELIEKRHRLNRMSAFELHTELTRCAGAIMECARVGDKEGMRHAYKAMKPIMKALYAK